MHAAETATERDGAARRTVLLCDAAFSAVPILFALRDAGFRVAVCGARPDDPGHGLADLSFLMDYSDRELLLRTVESEGIDFLVPGCTDVSYLSCAWVAERLHLPGFDTLETTLTINRKHKFRELCRTQGFPTPRSVLTPSEISKLRFPILVKPTDSFSGKGIIKVNGPDELSQAIDRAKAVTGTRSLVFEEFVEGKLYSHSAFLRKGKIVDDFFVREYCTVHPYQVNSSHLCIGLKPEIVRGVRQWLESFSAVLGLADGLVHTQFISDGSNFHLIEVTRRCPGDLYALLIEKSTGLPYVGMYAAAFCGLDHPHRQNIQEARFVSRHTVSVEHDCVFFASRITIPDARISFVPLKKVGEPLRAAPLDRAGIYFIEHDSVTQMKEVTPDLKHCVIIESAGHA
jgi:biotin carboxylase